MCGVLRSVDYGSVLLVGLDHVVDLVVLAVLVTGHYFPLGV